MPVCPHCHRSYPEGEIFCSSCRGSTLTQEDERLCPDCGAELPPQQVNCSFCPPPLTMTTPEKFSPLLRENPSHPKPLIHLWMHGFVVAMVLVIIISLSFFFFKGFDSAPDLKEARTSPAPAPGQSVKGPPASAAEKPKAPPASAAPEASPLLKTQLEEVMAVLREANLKKDISRFMSLYAPTFPQLDQKRQETLKIWEAYDYLSLTYKIDDLKPLGPDRVSARITWQGKIKEKRTTNLREADLVYQATFKKTSDKWLIQALEKAG